jgi:predicted glycogen debranching enzyme
VTSNQSTTDLLTTLLAALPVSTEAEWLEADGLGGFAMGTTAGVRTRRYHALLCAATAPPAGRMVLLSGFDAFVVDDGEGGIDPGVSGSGSGPSGVALSSQAYAPATIHPAGHRRIRRFALAPWPTWDFDVGAGRTVRQEILAIHGSPVVVVRWSIASHADGGALASQSGVLRLRVRPYLAGRDFHGLMHENPVFDFTVTTARDALGEHQRLSPYPGVPHVRWRSTGRFAPAPDWYRRFDYCEEAARGLDHLEDLATPGWLELELGAGHGDALWLVGADLPGAELVMDPRPDGAVADLRTHVAGLIDRERRRRVGLGGPLERAADQYLVRRGAGRTIIAGYPWFGDWGRDTFIALRGLCLATGRFDEAGSILAEWAGLVDRGLLPNRFPDSGAAPEYNSVDAALWYVIAADAWLAVAPAPAVRSALREPGGRAAIEAAIDAIVDGMLAGTRYHIGVDQDGLLAAGEPGVQLTWMDAKLGDWVVTPRIGKPVEIQALWLNALAIAARRRPELAAVLARGQASFAARFWNPAAQALFDVVDVDHQPGKNDPALRPNQLLAIGGLPLCLVDEDRARAVLATVERELLTPLGPRTLAPSDPDYAPRCAGGVYDRDAAYHQGTVWPWLAGPFVQAWLRVHGDSAEARAEAQRRFIAPLLAHVGRFGLGHVAEIADGESPHTPRGCPFQAWSVAELIRAVHLVDPPAPALSPL